MSLPIFGYNQKGKQDYSHGYKILSYWSFNWVFLWCKWHWTPFNEFITQSFGNMSVQALVKVFFVLFCFNWIVHFDLYEFIYLGFKSFARYICYRYFHPIYGLPLHFINGIFWLPEIFSFKRFQFDSFIFYACWGFFLDIWRNPCLSQSCNNNLLCFLLENL